MRELTWTQPPIHTDISHSDFTVTPASSDYTDETRTSEPRERGLIE